MKKLVVLSLLLFISSALFAAENGNSVGKNTLDEKLIININGQTDLTATLYDNSSSRAMVELLKKGPVTIDMHDFSNFEKVGELPVTLPRNDTYTETDSGDLILYLGKRFVIYYDKNSWNFTPLGKVEGVSKPELKKILGSGNVTAVLTLR
ncbi:MAG: hypothetical protein IKZ57_04355 [Spirochaetia bacterium]|nr:hypothetical protein [Spirochaetia bacterium]